MNFRENRNYKVTGIMSGTSLDGMDLAACNFILRKSRWEYTIEHAVTYTYTPEWKNRLQSLFCSEARDLAQAHFDYGKLTGEFASRFHLETGFDPMLIASHGHTVFHDPANGFTMQIGNGATIAAIIGKPVVCDFRAMDVCLGGQGAPLVPIGDELLFHQYDACLNLGGFSNISFNRNGKRIAFDICPVNTILNLLAAELGLDYDNNGQLARDGKTISELLEKLNSLPFYSQLPPKSLGTEWLLAQMQPVLSNLKHSTADKLRTFVEHIAFQIARVILDYRITEVLITGGGANNIFLLDRLKSLTECKLVVPEKTTVEYKEALVFALLGLLRWFGKPNSLASATGASYDAIGGAVYMPAK